MDINGLIWGYPEYGVWAVAVLVFVVLSVVAGILVRRRAVQVVHTTILDAVRVKGAGRRTCLRAVALVLLAPALLGPAIGSRSQTVDQVSRPVLLVADYSRSMAATDIAPNRLVRMRDVVANLMRSFPAYRYGLVIFAGDAQLRVPFTFDHEYIDDVLRRTEPEHVTPQGTDLRQPLDLAIRIADMQQLQGLSVILMTDGEHNGPGDMDEMIPALKARDIRVLTVGIGDAGGAPIPVGNGYVKDRQGNQVLSRPDLPLLQQIAGGTGGVALHIKGQDFNLNPLAPALARINATRGGSMHYQTRDDKSEWLIAAALLFLLWSLLPLPLLGWRPSMFSAVLVLALVGCRPDADARKAMESGQPEQAARWYAEQAAETGEPAALANLGSALFDMQDYASAATAYMLAATRETNPRKQGDDLYNAANALFRAGDIERAVSFYERAIETRDDEDTRYNLELARRILQQLEQQQQQQQQEQEEQDDEQDGDAAPEPGDGEPPEEQEDSGGKPESEQDRQAPEEGQEPQPGEAEASDQEPVPDDLGVLLRQRIEQLEESNQMRIKGQGSDSPTPW